MTRLALALIVLAALACPCAAADRHDVRLARQNRKTYEAQIGVTTLKWQTRQKRAAALWNFSQPFRLFNPITWIL